MCQSILVKKWAYSYTWSVFIFTYVWSTESHLHDYVSIMPCERVSFSIYPEWAYLCANVHDMHIGVSPTWRRIPYVCSSCTHACSLTLSHRFAAHHDSSIACMLRRVASANNWICMRARVRMLNCMQCEQSFVLFPVDYINPHHLRDQKRLILQPAGSRSHTSC
jgi:hypothetical protein